MTNGEPRFGGSGLDPWDLIGVPVMYALLGIRASQEWLRLNWRRRFPKSS